LSLLKENSFLAEEDINRASLKFELDHKRVCSAGAGDFNNSNALKFEIFFLCLEECAKQNRYY
jgi:hypothetical protein